MTHVIQQYDCTLKIFQQMILQIVHRLGRSRLYHYLIAIFGITLSVLSQWDGVFRIDYSGKFLLMILSVLGFDSIIRFYSFGSKGILNSVDFLFSLVVLNCGCFGVLFPGTLVMDIESLISLSFVIRTVVAIQHSIEYKNAFKPRLKRLLLDVNSTVVVPLATSVGSKQYLDICYITSRIIVVSKASVDSLEQRFLEHKYASLLNSVSVPMRNSVSIFSQLSDQVDSLVSHLFANPAHVVSVTTPPNDSNPILLVCAVLIRTGAATTASRALQVFAENRFDIRPTSPELLIPRCLYSQLRIFESLTARRVTEMIEIPGGKVPDWHLKRIVFSQIDPNIFRDSRLCLVQIADGKHAEFTPSISSTSVTFTSPLVLTEPDIVFVILDDQGEKAMSFYLNTLFNLTRIVAMQHSYHYVLNSDFDCDHFGQFRGIGARIEIFASPCNDDLDGKPPVAAFPVDVEELLRLPQTDRIAGNTPPPNCQIV
jgi:hypothetical protein